MGIFSLARSLWLHAYRSLLDSVLSAFFRQGQVLETFRGKGVYQPAVDVAIEKLDQGGWVCATFPSRCCSGIDPLTELGTSLRRR